MVEIRLANPDDPSDIPFHKKDGSVNDVFWLKWLYIYYDEYIDWTEWETKTGKKYNKAKDESANAWHDVFLPFFEHYGYDEFCFPVFKAFVEQTQDILRGFDKNWHLDLVVEKDGKEYKLHFPSAYDLL